MCVCYGKREAILEGFTDSDMAGDVDTKKSTSGYLFTFVGGAISWKSKLQRCVALSTTEAEYIAITEGCKELLCLKTFNEVVYIEKVHISDNGADMLTKVLPSGKHEHCCRIAGLDVVPVSSPY
ncbi:hypothetical protein LIER_38241 [Lithospermum erythrorhizon]|uniref:Retrovirus-related Pol polyprotein from transposon TNT 1-94 n=1 Tax=Lithospermum erythrorhizon TaxID=34254 RepID=A0AAV3PXK0_LITER